MPAKKTQPQPEPTMLYLMKQVELATRSRLDDLFRPIGMMALQYTALTVLERTPDLTSAQLARNSFVTAQTMAGMVTALEAQGLLERHSDPMDRRRLVLALTDDGKALLRKYRRAVAALEQAMLAGIPERDVARLRRILNTCRTNLSKLPAR